MRLMTPRSRQVFVVCGGPGRRAGRGVGGPPAGPGRHDGVRRRASDSRRWPAADRERHHRRLRRPHCPGRPRRDRHGAGRRDPGQPGRQDRDADHRRHARAPEHRPAMRCITDLRQRAYFGVSAAMSLGLDPPGDPFKVRAEAPAGAARYFLAGRGITSPEPGRTDVPYWITTEAEARKAVQEQAALKVDFIKIWVDDRDGKYQKLPPAILHPGHRRSAQAQAAGRRAHLQPVGRQGPAQGRHRRLRARHPRRRRRRRGGGAGQGAARTSC